MLNLSAIILTKNSENQIVDCIDSVREVADEIIVIDNGSTDRTVEVSKHYGAKVYQNEAQSFAEKRNYGLKKAKGKWVLYLDSDERLSIRLKESILKVVKDSRSEYDAYKIYRKNFYFGHHEWPHIETLERLFKRSSLKGWYGDVHESPEFRGNLGQLEGNLLHYTHKDLTTMVKKTLEWSKIEAELRLKSNHPPMKWWRFPRVMLTAYYDSYIRQKGYKAGSIGVIESVYQSFSMFITYARLWEMQQKKKYG